ncbi:circadian clock protein PASD1 [Microtus pennsylvanicus]|uniref:circadian clock protein PASD1 n=1 Tax=Microtus pennsylvanicus TaxID=10058 RepID=UPI003F6D2D8F
MNRHRHQKTRRVVFNPHHGLTYEDLHSLMNILQRIVDSIGYGASRRRPRARSAKRQTTIPAAPSNPREALNMGVNYDGKEVPIFQTYEEFHKTVVQSFENISIILSTDGKVVFISQNVSSLLGHDPEDIVGKSLLNILLDGEKEEIAQKIILNPPLAKSVGSLIEFCCYVRKRNADLFAKDAYNCADMYDRRDTYEYVKFVLYLQDSYDESFVIFGNYGRCSRNICSSTPGLLREQQYYLVGTISVLRTRAESEQPAAIQPPVIVIDSDDDNNTQCQRLRKQCKRKEIQGKHQAENLNAQSPESSSDVEIVDVIPAPQQIPFELSQVRTPSRSSICTTISIATSMNTSISSSGDFAAIAASLETSTSEEDSMREAKNRLDPVDMEFEVGPGFLFLSDSQEGKTSPEHGDCSDENGKKPLEEATSSKPKEHAIDEVSDTSLDDSYVIVEDTEVQKDPKIQEHVVDQEQGHQKTAETSAKSLSPVAQPVRPEAVVEPMVCTELPSYAVAEPRRALNFQHPLLGERFPEHCGARMRTQVYDVNICRIFNEEPPSYREVEEEERAREQCEYELAQHIGMLRNLPYELPRAQEQMGQGQENQVYHPREQMVTIINDLGAHPFNFFGNGNSEYPRNETHSFPLLTTEERADHTSCPLPKKIPAIFILKRTSILIHEGKMRQKTDHHGLGAHIPLLAADRIVRKAGFSPFLRFHKRKAISRQGGDAPGPGWLEWQVSLGGAQEAAQTVALQSARNAGLEGSSYRVRSLQDSRPNSPLGQGGVRGSLESPQARRSGPAPPAALARAGAVPAELGARARGAGCAPPPLGPACWPSPPKPSAASAGPTPSSSPGPEAWCAVQGDDRGLATGARLSRVARQARGARPELARQGAGGGSDGAPRGKQGQTGGCRGNGQGLHAWLCGAGASGALWPGPVQQWGARGGGREAGQGGTKRGDRWDGPGALPTGSRWAGTGALLEEAQQRGGGLRAQTGRPPPGPGER